ncbi:RAB-interacting protein [Trypanosoma theileri]|uniref:PRA1 family protein n=1 Tax=Trypanosoma theileri TaxID=67003 RepID=A0A1X0P0Z7_9TRYP|nr:RAB-interacting protein [Trypanosoma theileri]ORC90616.1 RAB-interacting protein [Trypanosoma theileri]
MQGGSPMKTEMAFVDGAEETSATTASLKGTEEPFSVAAAPSTFVGKVQYYYTSTVEGTRRQLALVRPWKEFFDRQAFASPAGLSDSLSRLNRNINYYYHNYIIMALVGSSYVLLLNPAFSLCLFMTLMMWWYVSTKRAEAAATNSNHFTLANREITFSQAYIFIILFGGVSFFLSNGSSVVFWLVLSSLGIVVAHAVLRKPTQEEQPFSFV